MPAEWEKQTAIWLSWPQNLETFEDFLPQVESIFIEFIRAISPGQYVNLLVNNHFTQQIIHDRLQNENIDLNQIKFHQIANVDVWFRDYGPTFVINPQNPNPLAMVKWTFNAWGDKYDDLKLDNQIPYEMNKMMHLPLFEPGIVLEGGSIDVNGCGCVLTTEQCLLNPNRNPTLSKIQIETYLKSYLNVKKVIWLKEGIAGDDTDGHIDDIARFVAPNKIVCALEENPNDANYDCTNENYENLRQMRDQNNEQFEIIKLPMPEAVYLDEQRYPASYANFYIGNSAVVVPIFGQANDEKALSIIRDLFPDRNVVGINCTCLVYGYGTLHCSSQQQPFV
jgi:agmatine deiminase